LTKKIRKKLLKIDFFKKKINLKKMTSNYLVYEECDSINDQYSFNYACIDALELHTTGISIDIITEIHGPSVVKWMFIVLVNN